MLKSKWAGGAVVSLALVMTVGLTACGGETKEEAKETPPEPPTAGSLLGAANEEGSAMFLSGAKVTASNYSIDISIAYDEAGNITESKTVEAVNGTTSTALEQFTYGDENIPVNRKYTVNYGNGDSTIDANFEPPTLETSDGTDTLVMTCIPEGQNDAGLQFQYSYELEDGAMVASGTSTSSEDGSLVADDQGQESLAGSFSMDEAFTYDKDGHVATYAISSLQEAAEFYNVTYADNKVTIENLDDGEWTLTEENGLMTKAVNEQAGVTIEFTYQEILAPSDFNRAEAKIAASRELITLALSHSIMNEVANLGNEVIADANIVQDQNPEVA